MTAKAGYEAWRERNRSLPSPDEFRIKRDGSLKVIWRDLERGWYSLYADFTWDADGNPVNGQMNEEAIGQPDYCSRNLTLLNEGALTQTLAHYAWQEKRA